MSPGAIVLDSNNNPHISCYDESHWILKHVYYDGKTWHTEVVDDDGDVGAYSSLALDSNQNPHISYWDWENDNLKYAYHDGNNWQTETIDEGGSNNSLALASTDSPRISYDNDGLKYAWCDMECHYSYNWHIETVETLPGGTESSLALDSNQNPHISYWDWESVNGNLKYAYHDGNNWQIETIDEGGNNNSLALDSNDKPHITYNYRGDLRYAYYDGATWHIDTVSRDGSRNSLALDSNDNPRICYYDSYNDQLRYAFIPCPNDFDCDTISDSEDNCITVGNPGQEDADEDGVGSICDNCLSISNPEQADADADRVGNVCDNCPAIDNPEQEDRDNDTIGDTCDPDLDGDDFLNEEDNCLTAYNPNQEDSDRDGFGGPCDSENTFALIDNADDTVVVFDLAGNLLYEKHFDDLPVFVTSSVGGWLVKGCPSHECSGDWAIWDLTPDLSIRNTLNGLGPGPLFAGITSGDVVSANPYTGIVDLYDTNGTIIGSTNVWEEEDGWPYNYADVGDLTSLRDGGFVVPPEGGYPDKGGGLYTPYLYFYDNNLMLIKKVDITSENIHLFSLSGLSNGGFAATCADYGDATDVDYLCYFTSEGELIEKIDISEDIPGSRYYQVLLLSGLQDGGVMISRFGGNSVFIYHSPPEELDLSDAGITSIGSITGNTFLAQYVYTKVAGKVRDLISGEPINGAVIKSSGLGEDRSSHGQYFLEEIPGRWTLRARAKGYATYITSLNIDPTDEYIQKNINMSPRSKPCSEDADCDDGDYCNGVEICLDEKCEPGTYPCGDDGLYCNGEEVGCDEDNDTCEHSGSPCPGHLACDEDNEECVEKECETNEKCDDGQFCNGEETCENGLCQEGINPCTDPTPACDEEQDICIEGPSIQLLPNPCWQSHWIPLPMFLRIVGTNTHFDGFSRVTFDPPGTVMALPPIFGDAEHLLMIGLLMPGWLATVDSIEVKIKTGSELISETLILDSLPFMMEAQKGMD
jgi:hypothetical protein